MSEDILNFDLNYSFESRVSNKSIIKIVGVGGGGSNAVNHMFREKIKDVEYLICNTDAQALAKSPIEKQIQLGANLKEGLGAGGDPENGRLAALESMEEIRNALSDGTKMVFITAGMGGGTGTGAAPVIGQVARELDLLTVGIVSMPFSHEGKLKRERALKGIEELSKYTDSLLIILNDKIFELFPDAKISQAFSKLDNVLLTAAKTIAEIITKEQDQNMDFEDVKAAMSNSKTAVMGVATAKGEGRAETAVRAAIASPLLNNRSLLGAKNVLLNIAYGTDEITPKELNSIVEHIQQESGDVDLLKQGLYLDDSLQKDEIRVIIVATGFDIVEDVTTALTSGLTPKPAAPKVEPVVQEVVSVIAEPVEPTYIVPTPTEEHLVINANATAPSDVIQPGVQVIFEEPTHTPEPAKPAASSIWSTPVENANKQASNSFKEAQQASREAVNYTVTDLNGKSQLPLGNVGGDTNNAHIITNLGKESSRTKVSAQERMERLRAMASNSQELNQQKFEEEPAFKRVLNNTQGGQQEGNPNEDMRQSRLRMNEKGELGRNRFFNDTVD